MWTGLPNIARIYSVHDLISTSTPGDERLSVTTLSDLLQNEMSVAGLRSKPTDYAVVAGPMTGTMIVNGNAIAHEKTEAALEQLRTTRKALRSAAKTELLDEREPE